MTKGAGPAWVEALWAGALAAGFALGFGAWRGGLAVAPLWGVFVQVLTVAGGAVALAHVGSLAMGAPVVRLSMRERLLLAVLVPVIGALLIGALLAAGDALARPLIRIAAFAIYRRRDPDPPAEVADVFRLVAAIVLAPLLMLVFALVMRLIVGALAPKLRPSARPLRTAHLAAALWIPALLLPATLAIAAGAPPVVTVCLAASLSAWLLGSLARRKLPGEGASVSAPVITGGTVAFGAVGWLAALWASLP